MPNEFPAEGWTVWAPEMLDQPPLTKVHVSELSAALKLTIPPKRTTYPSAESKEIPARNRPGGEVEGESSVQTPPEYVHVSESIRLAVRLRPPKSTTYPSWASYAITPSVRADGPV